MLVHQRIELYAGRNNVRYSNNYVNSLFQYTGITTFGMNLDHKELNHGSKGGTHFI